MRRLFFDHALLPNGWARNASVDVAGGVIAAIEIGARKEDREHLSGIAIPAMPNLHSHAFQRAMAGLTEFSGPSVDSFWSWRSLMYRFVGAFTPEDCEAVAAYAFMEMLEGGFSAVAEFHYLHHQPDGQPYANLAEMAERIAAAANQSGIGLTLLPVQYQYGGFGNAAPVAGQRRFLNDPQRFLKLVDASRVAISAMPGSQIGIAPHSLRAVSPVGLREVLAATPAGPVHIHVAEQVQEVRDCLSETGQRPLEWLLANHAVDRRWCLIHATQMTASETRALARSGAVAGLCPLTEASLGDGIFDGQRHLAASGAFGVGSDSNIEISAPAELKQYEYSQRLKVRARNVMSKTSISTGHHLWQQACAGGAQALGQEMGALRVGARADIVLLDHNHPDMICREGDAWLDTFVFVTGKSAIRAVIAAGETIVEDGRHVRRPAIEAVWRRALKRLQGAM
ncbi:MAG: formimidoylglutamate deiminase [Bosea sp. (in: a-proteobacteria)]